MKYKFKIKECDKKDTCWLFIEREEKTEGFCLDAKELNSLQIIINKYFEKLREFNHLFIVI